MLSDGGRVWRGNFLAAVGGSVEEELKDERSVSGGLSFLFPPPFPLTTTNSETTSGTRRTKGNPQ